MSPPTLASRPVTTGLQKKLTNESDKLASDNVHSRLPLPHQASRLSASQSGASSWLTAYPASNKLTMSCDKFKVAVWAYFLLPIPVSGSKRCPSSSVTCAAALQPHQVAIHAMSCPGHSNPALNGRHDRVKRGTLDGGRECCDNAEAEVEIPRGDGRGVVKPDVVIRLKEGDKLRLVDVVVSCPSAATYVNDGSYKTALFTAARAEREKKSFYASTVRERNVEFTPFALESSGAFGESAKALISELAERHRAKHSSDKRVVYARLLAEISVALHMGNADLLMSFLNNLIPVAI